MKTPQIQSKLARMAAVITTTHAMQHAAKALAKGFFEAAHAVKKDAHASPEVVYDLMQQARCHVEQVKMYRSHIKVMALGQISLKNKLRASRTAVRKAYPVATGGGDGAAKQPLAA